MTEQDKFSIGLKLTDLNDFINPSQTCVSMVKTSTSSSSEAARDDQKRAKIELTDGGEYVEVSADGQEKALQDARISLNDCLACSGCITSAESVLITSQSVDKLLAALKDSKSPVVVSFSPQALASLGAHFGEDDPARLFARLQAFCTEHLRAAEVVDTATALDASVLAVAQEFVAHYKATVSSGSGSGSAKVQPLIVSECPGWVCYAEKTHPEALPHMSHVRSAMALAGAAIKARRPDALHVSVMPCYDKKLEASRDDFYDAEAKRHDVDLVLASSELIELFDRLGVKYDALPAPKSGDGSGAQLYWNSERGSVTGGAGGYLENVLRIAAKELFGVDSLTAPGVHLKSAQMRNADMREYVLRMDGRKEHLKFVAAYGFRNIQNVVRKIKMGTCSYHFVEVMACPRACINGGGQAKPPKDIPGEEWVAKVKNALDARTLRRPEDNKEAVTLLAEAEKAGFLNTQYHDRQDAKPANPLQLQW